MTTEPAPFAARLRALLHHRAIAAITAALSVVFAAYVADKTPLFTANGLRIRVQIALYLLAALLVTRIVILAALSRFSPRTDADITLPLGPLGALRGRAAWLVPLAAFVAMTLMREGEIEALAFDFSLSSDHYQTQSNSSRDYHVTTVNAERRTLSQLALSCLFQHYGGDSEIERGFDNYVHCPRELPRDRDQVSLQIDFRQPDVFCSVPLYRTAHVQFNVNIGADARWGEGFEQGSGHGIVTVNGTIDITSRGFMSCRRFNQMIGERIGAITVDAINGLLRSN